MYHVYSGMSHEFGGLLTVQKNDLIRQYIGESPLPPAGTILHLASISNLPALSFPFDQSTARNDVASVVSLKLTILFPQTFLGCPLELVSNQR